MKTAVPRPPSKNLKAIERGRIVKMGNELVTRLTNKSIKPKDEHVCIVFLTYQSEGQLFNSTAEV